MPDAVSARDGDCETGGCEGCGAVSGGDHAFDVIPAAVGLLESWTTLADILLPVLSITVAVTFLVMIVAGKVTGLRDEEGGRKRP